MERAISKTIKTTTSFTFEEKDIISLMLKSGLISEEQAKGDCISRFDEYNCKAHISLTVEKYESSE